MARAPAPVEEVAMVVGAQEAIPHLARVRDGREAGRRAARRADCDGCDRPCPAGLHLHARHKLFS